MENEVLETNPSKLVEIDVKIIGDKTTACQLVQLLAFIRHAIQNKKHSEIKVNIGSKVNSDFFGFQVNGSEIKDYITQSYIEIN